MLHQPNGDFAQGHPKVGGRTKGTPNKRTTNIQAIAAAIVQDPQVQATLLQQARDGTLPAPILQMLFYYAYGKPVDRLDLHSEHRAFHIVIRRPPLPETDFSPPQAHRLNGSS